MLEQFSVATAMSSPTCPVDMPGAVSTHRQGFPDEFLPNGAGIVLFENHWPPSGHCFVVVFHHGPVRERVRAVPRLAPVPERGELLSLRIVGVALERLVRLRVVEAKRREDAGLEHRLRPDRRVDEAGIGVAAVRGAPPERWLSNGNPGSPLVTWVAELFTSTTAPAFAFVPTNAWCAGWVPWYWQGLLLPFVHWSRRSCARCCVSSQSRPIVTVFAPGA